MACSLVRIVLDFPKIKSGLMCAGLPPRIPWRVKGAASQEPKFVADVPQEGLARQLRLCGFDAKVAPSMTKDQRHLVHRWALAVPR